MADLRTGDRVAVLSFNEKPRVELPLTGDLKEFKRLTRIGLLNAGFRSGLPAVLDAAVAGANYLSAQPGPHQRRAILMFTADVGSGKREDHIATTRAFWNSDALLSTVVIPTRLTRFTHNDNPLHFGDVLKLGYLMKFSPFDSVDELAGLTGGELVYAGGSSGGIRELMERMRRRYRLYYDRPVGKAGQTHQLEVALSPHSDDAHPDARVVARKGYVMPRLD